MHKSLFSLAFLVLGLVVSAADDEAAGKNERELLEPYMTNLIRLDDIGGYHSFLFSTRELQVSNNLTRYIFGELLGAVVKAGYKTREYHLNNSHPCVGLKKLYQYWDVETKAYRVSTDFLKTRNKGDRQPIGMCAAEKGQCGADVELLEYSYKAAHGSTAYTTGILNDPTLGENATVVGTVCHIFSRSKKQQEAESELNPNENYNYGNLQDKLIPIYLFSNTSANSIYYPKPALQEALKKQNGTYRHAFNLIAPKSHNTVAKVCELRPVAQYLNDEGHHVLFDDPAKDSEVLAEGYKPFPDNNTYILGYGIQKDHHCGSRIKYEIKQNKNGDTRAIDSGQVGGDYTKSFHNAFFYSL